MRVSSGGEAVVVQPVTDVAPALAPPADEVIIPVADDPSPESEPVVDEIVESDLEFLFWVGVVTDDVGQPDRNTELQFQNAGPETPLLISDGRGGGVSYGFFTELTGAAVRDDRMYDGTVGLLTGIVPGTDVGAVSRVGRATYTGEYAVTQVRGFDEYASGAVVWDQEHFSGPITLRANLETGQFIGRSVDRRLIVEGDGLATADPFVWVTFNEVGGSASFSTGEDAIVGAFFGGDEDVDFAGGLVALRDMD